MSTHRADDATCPGTPNFECFVARPSNCTLADAVAAGADILALGEARRRLRREVVGACELAAPPSQLTSLVTSC